MSLRSIWRPAVYHGHAKAAPYFEGWYYKLVDATTQHRYAIIPGIFKHADPAETHAFVQVLDGVTGTSAYHRYPAGQFAAARDVFDVRVGPNRFALDRIALDIDAARDGTQATGTLGTLGGELRFDGVQGWPVRALSPGIMGWYGLVPFMECYHGVLGFDHAIQGALRIGGAAVDFGGGRGYIEKDWGAAFPRGYIWMQTNHFSRPGISLTASVALIPWLSRAFRGFIVGLWCDGTLYRFATYTGARIERLALTDTHVQWVLHGTTGPDRRGYRLHIDAERAEGGLLHAPDRGAMVARIVESMTARIAVQLVADDGDVVLADTGRFGGLEIAGDLDAILDGYAGRDRGTG